MSSRPAFIGRAFFLVLAEPETKSSHFQGLALAQHEPKV
jgi:hypothetical protein